MRKLSILLVLAALIFTAGSAAAADQHVKANLVPVGDSGISGFVQIVQMPQGGTNIHVVARGLTPGVEYLSIYYDNHTCELQPDSPDDIFAYYNGNPAGIGVGHAKIDDDLDEVNSVSVRLASDLTLMACADIHP